LLIGEIAGCPFYIDREQYERWRKPQFLIDVAAGDGDTFSLEGPEGMHFVAHTAKEPDAQRQIPQSAVALHIHVQKCLCCSA